MANMAKSEMNRHLFSPQKKPKMKHTFQELKLKEGPVWCFIHLPKLPTNRCLRVTVAE